MNPRNLMKTFIPAFLFFLISHSIIAQNQVIGAWREHLPYNRAKMVADAGSKIYCATADGLFSYIKDDGNLERFSKLNGLNDFGISAIAYNNTYHVLIIAYSNANIDLLYDDHSVYNLSFIKDKSITGNKNINNIYIKGKYAYMACGFGIVVLDIERQEVKETYIIGANGSNINIWDVTDDGNKIYAATDSSVLTASLTGSNLADFNNWSIILKDTGNAGDFNIIRFFGNKIYVNYAKPDAVSTQTDELWKLESGNWTLVNQPDLQQQPKRYSMKVVNDELIITNNNSVSVYDTSFQRTDYFDNNAYPNPQMRDAFFENNDIVWIADFAKGLIKIENSGATTMIFPRGPFSSYTADIAIKNKKLWVAHGPRSASWNPQEYPIDGFSFYNNGEWQSWNKLNTPELITNSFNSNMSLSIYPGQDEHIRVGSVTNGLLDFNKNSGFTFYNKNNSTLQPAVGNEAETIVHGIVHDDDGNLWVVNSGVQNVIHVLKTDGIWRTFDMTGVV